MPKSSVAHGAGNINMKGKKTLVLRCRCCVCEDFREQELKKAHLKEMRNAKEANET